MTSLKAAETHTRFAKSSIRTLNFDLRIPAERLTKLGDASHFLQEDSPDQVSQAILALVELPAPPAP